LQRLLKRWDAGGARPLPTVAHHDPYRFTIPDPAFEEWLWATRPQLHDLACNALERAADAAVVEGDIREAIELLRRLVELDLLREETRWGIDTLSRWPERVRAGTVDI